MRQMRISLIIAGLIMCFRMTGQEVKWYTFEQAIELNKKEPRKIIVDVFTDWCGYCKLMDKNTFSNPIIANYLNTTFYPVKFNAEQKETIKIDTSTFKYIDQGGRGYHELAVALLNGQMSYPSIVFLNEKNQIFYINKGYCEPKQFDEILKFLGGGFYLNSKWESWKADYKSPFN